MASPTQHEEVHHRKEEPELDQADLNKEAKHDDDDDKKIMASESATSEQEVKDANQEDDDKIVVPSTTTTTSPRSLTQEEEEMAREKEALAAAILWSLTNDAVPPKNPSVLEIDDDDEDDSEQTLRFLTRWKAPKIPPKKIIHKRLIEQCSRPIQKQLTATDVKETKLSLSRKKFQQLLDEKEARRRRKEIRVSVYGPDGKVHEICWIDVEERLFELVIGWRKFVVDYELKAFCDFLTVWMFRHRDTQKICLAVDVTRFAFRTQVSKRISDAAFEDSD